MAKIKTFYHRIVIMDSDLKLSDKNKQKQEEFNVNQVCKRDDEINEFIKDKKILNINTTTQNERDGHGSKTSGYLTTILYED